MNRATRVQLPAIAQFLVDRFWDLELFSFLSQGMAQPRQTIYQFVLSELSFFFTKGDVYLYDINPTGVLVGIPCRQYSLFRQLCYSFRAQKMLKNLSSVDKKLFLRRSRLLAELHGNTAWYKKYTRNGYYIIQLAVHPSAKGSGVLRSMLTPIMQHCQDNGMDIVLETFTPDNVPIYEHFGFTVAETHSISQLPFCEYCLIKRC